MCLHVRDKVATSVICGRDDQLPTAQFLYLNSTVFPSSRKRSCISSETLHYRCKGARAFAVSILPLDAGTVYVNITAGC